MKFRLELLSQSHEIEIIYIKDVDEPMIIVDGQFFDSRNLQQFEDLKIIKEGQNYSILIENHQEHIIFKQIGSGSDENDKSNNKSRALKDYFKDNKLLAPIPGKIIDIKCKLSQNVKEGQVIIVIEAMKMENEISAPINGKIKSISVKLGEMISINQVMIEIEESAN